MIVVPVLMINCHVSEKPNNGPVIAQTTTTPTQVMNVVGVPAAWATAFAILVNSAANDMGHSR